MVFSVNSPVLSTVGLTVHGPLICVLGGTGFGDSISHALGRPSSTLPVSTGAGLSLFFSSTIVTALYGSGAPRPKPDPAPKPI